MEKVLICITTCNRLSEVKKYILPYIEFVNKEKNYSFLLALDGNNIDYTKFCENFQIPLIHSELREGVGISKNRVLSKFPNFDHYFFIDDDVELFDSQIFSTHISIAKSATPQYHHLSSTKFYEQLGSSEVNGNKLLHGARGGGYFNYFTNFGLKKVGGWHTEFAKYKRYGHTEHTYRYCNAGLAKYPFTVIEKCILQVIVHNPDHVTPVDEFEVSKSDELFIEEKKLIQSKLEYFPVSTISPFHYNGFDMCYNRTVADFLKVNKRKYPLIKGRKRLRCLSSYYFFMAVVSKNSFYKLYCFCNALLLYPLNPEIKHSIKSKLKLNVRE